MDSPNAVFEIGMAPAGHGDCLLLRYGAPQNPFVVLIDGGPYHCYPGLRRRIEELSDGLQLLVVTHVDADHVEGIVKLLQDSLLNIPIHDVWYNGWRHLQPDSTTLGPVAGEYLSALLTDRVLSWNRAFQGQAVSAGPVTYPVVKIAGGLTLTVLSPTPVALQRLRRVWVRAVLEAGLIPGSAREAAGHMARSRRFGRHEVLSSLNLDSLSREAESSDDSPVNGSSIALLAEFGDRRILLAGDAHPDVLEQAVRGWLTLNHQARLQLDAFKLAHHGSERNITCSLLNLLECDNYLISTNGDYFGHPDDEAIARVIRHGGPRVRLHFNYPQPRSRFWDDPEIREREKFQVVYPDDGNGLKVDLNSSP